MIVEQVIEDTRDFLEHDYMMDSPMNLTYFFGGSHSPYSDVASSPTHSISSGPGSPESDSEGSLGASWPQVKKGKPSAKISKALAIIIIIIVSYWCSE